MERSAGSTEQALPRPRFRSRWLQLLGHGVLLVAVGVADRAAAPELDVAWLYLLPVALIAWRERLRMALAAAAAGALLGFYAEYASAAYDAHPGALYWNGGMLLLVLLGVAVAVHRLGRLSRLERLRVSLDLLTGTYNTRTFYLLAEREIRRSLRYGRALSVAYIDIDAFRHINAAFSHTAGDVLLRRAAEVIRNHTRAADLVARIGSDEFVILFAETGYTGANRAVRELMQRLTERMPEAGWPVTFSVGVATYTTPPREVRSIIEQADTLMRQAKREGGGRFVHKTFG